jgi:hypothetical protein
MVRKKDGCGQAVLVPGKKFHFSLENSSTYRFYISETQVFDKKEYKMRHLRIKPTETDTIMHVYNRITAFSEILNIFQQ